MRKFPGTIEVQGHRYVLNDEQKAWLAKWFPVTENRIVASSMGISVNRLHGFARELCLKKSEAGMKAIIKRQSRRMAKTNERNGVYARKRGHPVSEATQQGNLRRWQLVKEGKAESPRASMKRKNPDGYQRMLEKMSVGRKELIRKERQRAFYGLERKTKLKAVVMCPFTSSQTAHRYNALQRGYLLDVDCSEGTPGRYVIYYDEETHRSPIFEANLIKDGFTIKKDE